MKTLAHHTAQLNFELEIERYDIVCSRMNCVCVVVVVVAGISAIFIKTSTM